MTSFPRNPVNRESAGICAAPSPFWMIVHAQKQAGRAWVGVALPVGRMTSEQMRALAGIAHELGDGDIRLTVWQNLWAARVERGSGWAGFKPRWLAGAEQGRAQAEQILEFSGLQGKRDVLAGNLAFGEQRRLELARAAVSGSPLLLLDEPAAGMNAEEIEDLDQRIRVLRDQGRTVVLIEHHMELVMGVCDRVAVLNFGRKIAEGRPEEVQNDEQVRAAYLGSDDKDELMNAALAA